MRKAIVSSLIAIFVSLNIAAQTPQELADAWDSTHITNKEPSDVRHADLKAYLEKLRSQGVRVEEVGRSNAQREIYQMEFGSGPIKIFLWSQMHGDEPTATSALIDIFSFFSTHKDTPWVKTIAEKLTIRAVPMLNPDGAELYTRRNLQGIDINRDALALATPEARLLKQLRDRWQPHIGFNLHNQQALTAVDHTAKQAAISFLVVYGDARKTETNGMIMNKRIVSEMIKAIEPFIPGHIARYGDEWTPTAFGDNFSAWGTPVILIETGALVGKSELYLAKINFIAMMTAFSSVATASQASASTQPYDTLPHNGSGTLVNYIFRGMQLPPNDGRRPAAFDVAVTAARRRASFLPWLRIARVGNLNGLHGLEEYDASGFYVVQRFRNLKVGSTAEFLFYRTDRVVDWDAEDLETRYEPDAIFSAGKWIKGEGRIAKVLF
ncbi:MAG: Zinc carboxypeptidase [Acidobacteria bacterium OLB17]|nr:MAG: Zinc carboxypeptidase [Acidobacteria bacterium OLB17]MCZ2390378.1 peptidase M14 [Acidobacteriota bacterium]